VTRKAHTARVVPMLLTPEALAELAVRYPGKSETEAVSAFVRTMHRSAIAKARHAARIGPHHKSAEAAVATANACELVLAAIQRDGYSNVTNTPAPERARRRAYQELCAAGLLVMERDGKYRAPAANPSGMIVAGAK
jgi:hypothetical protein